MVCNISTDQEIDVQKMYTEQASHATFGVDFPGLIFRPPDSPVVLLLFKSGRIVVTGAKKYDDIFTGFKNVFDVIKPYFVSRDD